MPSDYEALVARRTDRPVVKGELNPVFQGIYSTRIEVKQTMRDLERILTSAEKASVLAGESNRGEIERAWEPVLFNQAHDLASGVMVDKVYDDSMAGYSFSRRLGEEILHARLDTVAARIDTQGAGCRLRCLTCWDGRGPMLLKPTWDFLKPASASWR